MNNLYIQKVRYSKQNNVRGVLCTHKPYFLMPGHIWYMNCNSQPDLAICGKSVGLSTFRLQEYSSYINAIPPHYFIPINWLTHHHHSLHYNIISPLVWTNSYKYSFFQEQSMQGNRKVKFIGEAHYRHWSRNKSHMGVGLRF